MAEVNYSKSSVCYHIAGDFQGAIESEDMNFLTTKSTKA